MEPGRIFARIASLLVLFLASSGAVHAADNTITVLGIEATDGAPESVASLVTDALRQRATSEKGMRLVPGKDLVDIKLIFSCPDEAPTCMADAAKNLGVSRMIFGSVKRAPGDSYVMTLKMLDVSRRQVVAWVGEPLSRTSATPAAIRGPVEKWFATLTGQSTTGTVRVRGDVPGISVALDGAPMGTTSGQEMLLNNVPAGRREIVASKPGYAPIRKEVSVVAGASVDVNLDLGGTAGAPSAGGTMPIGSPYTPTRDDEPGLSATAQPSDGRDALKWGSWATAAASVASFGLAVKFAFDVKYFNEQLDPYRRFPCPGAPAGSTGCGLDGTPQPPPTRDVDLKFIKETTDEGATFQNYEFIALGVGGVFAIASGVLFYLGYFAEEPSSGRLGKADGGHLKLVPYATGDGGGLSAFYRF